ncbi:MAG: S-methyl-5-thioribose-1-phosphate isomerase [candidate division WOR-3 bacterium]
MLDQTKLPEKISYRRIKDYRLLIKAIRELQIRGAPLIGVAAAYGVALEAVKTKRDLKKRLCQVIKELKNARPTGFNIFWTLKRMEGILSRQLPEGELRTRIVEEAVRIDGEEKKRCDRIGRHGAKLLEDGTKVLTICNTGILATTGIGTALGVIYKAKEEGKDITVFVCETRPLLQGARLTTWELKKKGIKAYLITDNMVGSVMKDIDIVLTGADRIARNFDFANKIGTLTLAICAWYYKKPFYCVAPTSTIDSSLKDGDEIIVEERKEEEVLTCRGKRIAPKGVKVFNPAFDVTPHSLLTGIITEKGIIKLDRRTHPIP